MITVRTPEPLAVVPRSLPGQHELGHFQEPLDLKRGENCVELDDDVCTQVRFQFLRRVPLGHEKVCDGLQMLTKLVQLISTSLIRIGLGQRNLPAQGLPARGTAEALHIITWDHGSPHEAGDAQELLDLQDGFRGIEL